MKIIVIVLKTKEIMPKYICFTLEWTFLAILRTARKLNDEKTEQLKHKNIGKIFFQELWIKSDSKNQLTIFLFCTISGKSTIKTPIYPRITVKNYVKVKISVSQVKARPARIIGMRFKSANYVFSGIILITMCAQKYQPIAIIDR